MILKLHKTSYRVKQFYWSRCLLIPQNCLIKILNQNERVFSTDNSSRPCFMMGFVFLVSLHVSTIYDYKLVGTESKLEIHLLKHKYNAFVCTLLKSVLTLYLGLLWIHSKNLKFTNSTSPYSCHLPVMKSERNQEPSTVSTMHLITGIVYIQALMSEVFWNVLPLEIRNFLLAYTTKSDIFTFNGVWIIRLTNQWLCLTLPIPVFSYVLQHYLQPLKTFTVSLATHCSIPLMSFHFLLPFLLLASFDCHIYTEILTPSPFLNHSPIS